MVQNNSKIYPDSKMPGTGGNYMKRDKQQTVIKGAPLSITPAGIFDSYKIEVEDAPLSPALVGQIITVNLPRGLRMNLGEKIGADLSADMIYSVSGIFKEIEIVGFMSAPITGYPPSKKEYSFKSLIRSNGGKSLFSIAVSGINVLIKEDASEKTRFPLWLSPNEYIKRLACHQRQGDLSTIFLDRMIKLMEEDEDEKFDNSGPNCDSCGITCCLNNPAYRDDDDSGSEDDECCDNCDDCPFGCEDDDDDSTGKDFVTAFAEAFRGGHKILGIKPIKQAAAAFEDCPFEGENGKYFKAFACPEEKNSPKEQKKIQDYINTICSVCKHNEICNSVHTTKFSAVDEKTDRAISMLGHTPDDTESDMWEEDAMLPDYFGDLRYSYENLRIRDWETDEGIPYMGLFVKNLTGSVTLVPGTLPLFDPHSHILTCIEICGLPEEAFNTLYRIIKNGGCPAVYISIPKGNRNVSLVSREGFAELYVKDKGGLPLSPERIVICDAAEGYSSEFTASVVNGRKKNAGNKGNK